jgi:hypothetical protein
MIVAGALFAGVAISSENQQFVLENNSANDIDELHITPSESETWGEDILGVDILMHGESATITIADGHDSCSYDMRFVLHDGSTVELENLDVCETHTVEFNR